MWYKSFLGLEKIEMRRYSEEEYDTPGRRDIVEETEEEKPGGPRAGRHDSWMFVGYQYRFSPERVPRGRWRIYMYLGRCLCTFTYNLGG